MTEAIIITAIIVGGIVALGIALLHYSYRHMTDERKALREAALSKELDVFISNVSPHPMTTEQVLRSLGHSAI